MEQEQIIEQILGLLADAGFQRSEIAQQVRNQFTNGADPISPRCTRDYEGMTLLLKAEMCKVQDAAGETYQLTRLFISQVQQSHRLELRAEEGDNMNIAYAMYQFAGKFNTLLLQIYALEFAAVSGETGSDIMRHRLKELPRDCQVQGHFSDHSGTADYSIHIVKAPQEYFVRDVTMKFTSYPELQHGTFAGVDTGELELDMAAVNWANEQELYFAGETGPVSYQTIQSILDRLAVLSTDIAGGYTGDILQLKYMQASGLSEVLIQDQAWETFARLPQKEAIFPADISLPVAANLMAGRYRLVTEEGRILPEAHTWQKMLGVTPAGEAILSRIEGYSWAELKSQVRRIVSHDDKAARIAARLAEGNLVRIKPQRDGKVIFVRADPVNRQLDLLTPDMRAIHFNFHFDPDWKQAPGPDPRLQVKTEHHHPKKTNRHHRKGKGLK